MLSIVFGILITFGFFISVHMEDKAEKEYDRKLRERKEIRKDSDKK